MKIKYLDMFAGIGGFRSGLNNVGDFFMPVDWCEIDKYAQKAYRTLYDTEGEYFCDDARAINPSDVPDIDLICAGFPCQPFSAAGHRLGFADTRGTLFHDNRCTSQTKCQWHEARRPAYLLLENVPGLLNHEGGKLSELSSPRFMSWGILLNGVCLTARISESHSKEKGYTLSDILIADCPEKYFLSPKAMERLLSNLYPEDRGSESTAQKEQAHV